MSVKRCGECLNCSCSKCGQEAMGCIEGCASFACALVAAGCLYFLWTLANERIERIERALNIPKDQPK